MAMMPTSRVTAESGSCLQVDSESAVVDDIAGGARAHAPVVKSQRRDIARDVQLEHADKERAKVVKHFNEEIPCESNRGRQIREGQASGFAGGCQRASRRQR